MLRSTRQTQIRQSGSAPLRRPGAVGLSGMSGRVAGSSSHPLCRQDENERLQRYERDVKESFDAIIPVLRQVSACQHDADFVEQAQRIAASQLGYELPETILQTAWVEQLDMRQLFAWCVFSTYKNFCDDYYQKGAIAVNEADSFDRFLQDCGFHTLDITPCADGRLAHVVRYALRLPQESVRRKSYAGALFDIEDSIQKWVKVELGRHREGVPNTADEPTRYLKVVVYHYSSVDPDHQGCAAHGSDTKAAAQAGLDKLNAFREAIENSFCCGASIDLLLIGLDTDTDAIRMHVPDAEGDVSLERAIDVMALYDATAQMGASEASDAIAAAVRECCPDVQSGMAQFIQKLIENNFSQIAYVRSNHGDHYADIGHAERFIGAGVGFEEIQLRNLMYFAYLDTVEEATADLDVGISIFSGLNVSQSLPIPIVVRFDYHGHVPGGRERAEQHCERVADALQARYEDLTERGLLHILRVTRDCDTENSVEIQGCSVNTQAKSGAH